MDAGVIRCLKDHYTKSLQTNDWLHGKKILKVLKHK